MAKPPPLPCRNDVVVENGTAAPKSCLSPLEMRTTTAAGGLLPTGEASTATKTTFKQPPLRLYSTEDTNLWTPILSVLYDSSFSWKNNPPAAPSCGRVIDTKSEQNRMFDPGGSEGRSAPACFWERGARCFVVRSCAGGDLQRFLEDRLFGIQKPSGVVRAKYLRRTYSDLSLTLRS